MITLTKEDCAHWLASRKIAADPYYTENGSTLHFEQFALPQHVPSASSIFRSIVACAEPFESALLHVTDWSLYNSDEMALVSCVRQACGERRPLMETPGHVFPASERDLLIGLVSLVTSFGWSAYLYFDHGLTLLSWEGEILDLWRTDGSRYTSVRDVLQHMGVSSIETGNG